MGEQEKNEMVRIIEENDNYEMMDGGEKIQVIQQLLTNIIDEIPMWEIDNEQDEKYIANVKRAIQLLEY